MQNINNEEYHYRSVVDSKEKSIPVIRSKKTTSTLGLTSKVSNLVKDNHFTNDEQLGVRVDKQDTQVLLTVINKIADEPITPFDLTVHNIVSTFYSEEQQYFTSKQIAQKLIGDKKTKPYKTLITDVEQSLYKMAKTFIGIDHTEQFSNWKIQDKYEDDQIEANIKMRYMLNLDIDLTIKLNNNVVSSFKLNQTPPLLEYSKIYRQLATTEDKLIDTAGYLTHNQDTVAIKYYLKDRIEAFKSIRSRKKKINNSDISYKTMYEYLNLQHLLTDRSENRMKFLNHVKNILEAYKNNGFIKSYKLTHEGRDTTINGKIVIGKIKNNDTYI